MMRSSNSATTYEDSRMIYEREKERLMRERERERELRAREREKERQLREKERERLQREREREKAAQQVSTPKKKVEQRISTMTEAQIMEKLRKCVCVMDLLCIFGSNYPI